MSRSDSLETQFREELAALLDAIGNPTSAKYVRDGGKPGIRMWEKWMDAMLPLLGKGQRALEACDEAYADKPGFYNGMHENSPCRRAWEIGRERAEERKAEMQTALKTAFVLQPEPPGKHHPNLPAARNTRTGEIHFYDTDADRDEAIRRSGVR